MGYADDDEQEQQQTQEIIDEEELSLIQRMKEVKKVYRQNFDALKDVKGQVFYVQQSIDSLKQSLVSAFEDWYLQNFDDGLDEQMSTLVSSRPLISQL